MRHKKNIIICENFYAGNTKQKNGFNIFGKYFCKKCSTKKWMRKLFKLTKNFLWINGINEITTKVFHLHCMDFNKF